jgi:hypothetical protein
VAALCHNDSAIAALLNVFVVVAKHNRIVKNAAEFVLVLFNRLTAKHRIFVGLLLDISAGTD